MISKPEKRRRSRSVVLHVAAFKGSLEASVSVKPPGPNIYLGESVLLQCTVESLSAFVKSYRWFRSKPHRAPPRHLVSGDSYFITAFNTGGGRQVLVPSRVSGEPD
ncbi:unnamed protein product [Pleuronectes platessa]|uniref:Ig-like domain-containing protein n=1 Tax=Pleuronectes platessa TaxID=8262 RepID=A0A9N7Z9G8_PLEPL|nr:unnamed protein product [Pleuronectes platessa]